MSLYAKSRTEVHTNTAKSIRMQLKCIFSNMFLCARSQWSLRAKKSGGDVSSFACNQLGLKWAKVSTGLFAQIETRLQEQFSTVTVGQT